ncbi:hypothetical protein [Proteus terrae]|uniref:hypothetical protein n=1 Tax=Proteus terrae TaxID=1574161 RepID=UPI00298CE0B6|nr:hypothetical protein [Proteus terrae]WPD00517.1 hypothetical protein R5P25_08410 [Proteus terrae]
MTPADFEESEYRGPLYNQLEHGNHLVWEPGQVFEKHIGIDRASYISHPYFWKLYGRYTPLNGVILTDYDWDYIWEGRKKMKILPNFNLNLFLQAKRPYSGTRPAQILKDKGIVGDYWKFSITPHQQIALEKMAQVLNKKAIVSYAAPAFHTQGDLYNHTENQTIVQNSTFPPVEVLKSHSAWYYNNGGVKGVGNPDFVHIEFDSLQTRIKRLFKNAHSTGESAEQSLSDLANTIISIVSEVQEPSPVEHWFQYLISRIDDLNISNQYNINNALKHYMKIRTFCTVYHLNWLVIGTGE